MSGAAVVKLASVTVRWDRGGSTGGTTMRRTLTMLATAAFALSLAGVASAQKLDANGKCHAADGKFAKAEVCAGAKGAAADAGPYKLDSKGNCHDAKGKMAKKAMCPKADAAPAKAAAAAKPATPSKK
jgi:hypothetical protein